MMIFIIFILLTILLNEIKCINKTVIVENNTEIGKLDETIELSCLLNFNKRNISAIIWSFDWNTFPVNLNKESNNVTGRIRGVSSGSLLIEKLQYNDSKSYTCIGITPELELRKVINLIVHGPPNNFGNFSYEALSDTELKVIWEIKITTNNAVNAYNLTLCKKLITNECDVVSVNHPNYFYVFNNLIPFTFYDVSIIAYNNVSKNTRLDINAQTDPGTPVAQPNISLVKINAQNVTLHIDCQACLSQEKMQGLFKYFVVSYNDSGGVKNLNFSSNTSKVKIINLHPYFNYFFNVSASNGVRSGPVNTINCRTLEHVPNSTNSLKVVEINSTEMKVKWEAASDRLGPITGYILKVHKDNAEVRKEELDHTTYSYLLTGLQPRSTYLIGLAIKNNAGLSNFTNITNTTDRPKPLPPKITQVRLSKNNIRVTWETFNLLNENSVLKYEICWTNLKLTKKCINTSCNDGISKYKCQGDSATHSADIPKVIFESTYSKLNFSVTIKVPSDFCNGCRFLVATSQEYEKDFSKDSISSTYIIVILLTIGCIVFFLGFFIISLFWGNRNFKELFIPNRTNGLYLRPPGEYVEIFPRSLSQPKILPLEKNPYPPILVKDLVDHIMDYRCDDGAGFQTEFEAIELMDTSRWSITYPNFKENKIKNRYTNIFPYDHSRVILQYPLNGKSDYINASFVDGYNRRNAYIATQGPLTETIGDFWQMVYEQNSEIIVMISNFEERGRRKCEVYWVPNKVVCYGHISVRQIYHKKMAFYTERRFGIKNIRNKKNAQKERIVYHYQYTDWRDFDVPPSSLPVLVFVKATIKHWSSNSGPIIVHCSAGVGRTGTYICIESEIRQMEIEHRINVRGFLEHIRQQRMKLVQTESQYTFIHDALYEYYLCPDHEIHKDILSSYIFQLNAANSTGFSKKIKDQFQMCIQFEPTNYEYVESKRSYNVSKNRSKILPIESRRINISCEPGIEGSNYINASAIQGYWEMKEFIITQHPLEETEPDFWKMVWDENCTTVILLSSESLPDFWPDFENEFRSYRWSRVNYCNSEDSGYISQHGFLLSSPREDYALDCSMHRLKRWPSDFTETADLLRLLFKVNTDKSHAPIVVIDDFGGSKAGIFVALSSLINQLRNDEVLDVYFIMKMIHMERPNTFSSSDDLKFVYDVLGTIVTNQNSYPFFTNPPPTFIPNGVSHQPSVKKSINNSSLITQYATLNTLPSKSSTSTSRRRASSAESEPFCGSNNSPVKSKVPHNRISWNPGETRYSAITDNFMDWSTSIGNGHYNNNVVPSPCNLQIISIITPNNAGVVDTAEQSSDV